MSGSLVTQDTIDRIEAAMAESIGNGAVSPQCPVIHRFAPGLYMREIHVPAGTLFSTATHRHQHFYVMLKGITRMISSTEGDVIHQAPCSGITEPGTRRMVYAEEDTIWMTIHSNPDNETDVEKLAESLLIPHENPLIGQVTEKWREEIPKSITG